MPTRFRHFGRIEGLVVLPLDHKCKTDKEAQHSNRYHTLPVRLRSKVDVLIQPNQKVNKPHWITTTAHKCEFCAQYKSAATWAHVTSRIMSSNPSQGSPKNAAAGAKPGSAKDEKAARLAEQLRANLKKRKSQQRGRKAAALPDSDQGA